MRYAITEGEAFLRLSDGEELHLSIAAACEEYSIDSAIILGGLGMAREITFGWYTGKEYLRELDKSEQIEMDDIFINSGGGRKHENTNL